MMPGMGMGVATGSGMGPAGPSGVQSSMMNRVGNMNAGFGGGMQNPAGHGGEAWTVCGVGCI